MKNTIVICLMMLSHGTLFSQVYSPSKMPIDQIESDFFIDNSASFSAGQRITLVNNAGDDSSTLQTVVNNLSALGGGVITISAGTWEFAEILMKSNVHLMISKDAIIRPSPCSACVNKTTNRSVFRIGSINATGNTENVSIRSLNDDGQFTIDLSGLEMVTDAGVIYPVRITPFNMKAVYNFMVSGCRVIDNFTVHAAMNCSASKTNTGIWGRPKQGLVKNLTVENAHGGYGAVQVRSGEKILFKNITSLSGGVTLRIETDDVSASGGSTPQEEAYVSEISGYNIKCKNGNAAVMIQPWGAHNGWFDVQKIEAIGCMAGVRIDRAYVELNAPSIGYFDTDSRITDVTSSYGTNAQVKEGVFPSVPCVLRTDPSILIFPGIPYMDDGSYHIGPSIAPILYRASSTTDIDPRYYSVKIPTENELSGQTTLFPANSLLISRSNNQVIRCPALSNESFDNYSSQVKIYPNPISIGNQNLTVDLLMVTDVEIQIYDLYGKIVYLGNFKGKSRVEINPSELKLTKGAYLIKVKGDKYLVSQKLLIL